jgi:hypothetical protein
VQLNEVGFVFSCVEIAIEFNINAHEGKQEQNTAQDYSILLIRIDGIGIGKRPHTNQRGTCTAVQYSPVRLLYCMYITIQVRNFFHYNTRNIPVCLYYTGTCILASYVTYCT